MQREYEKWDTCVDVPSAVGAEKIGTIKIINRFVFKSSPQLIRRRRFAKANKRATDPRGGRRKQIQPNGVSQITPGVHESANAQVFKAPKRRTIFFAHVYIYARGRASRPGERRVYVYAKKRGGGTRKKRQRRRSLYRGPGMGRRRLVKLLQSPRRKLRRTCRNLVNAVPPKPTGQGHPSHRLPPCVRPYVCPCVRVPRALQARR